MKIKTSELIGAALDWAVAVSLGAIWNPKSAREAFFIWPGTLVMYSKKAPNYTTDWAQGGPIIEREKLGIDYFHIPPQEAVWFAGVSGTTLALPGPTPLIAAMRCFVASKLGEVVDVPEELK